MRSFQVFRYLKKWMPLIILFFVAMTAVSYYFLSSQQKYVAQTIIHYDNSGAVDGLAPDNTEIDVGEINSSHNVTTAMNNLGLSAVDFSVEKLCASINATPVVKEETSAIQEALNEQGERYTEEPTEYLVTCTMGNEVDEDFVRNLLSEVLDVYFSEYSRKHINRSQISNKVKEIQLSKYDYLEAVEKIDEELTETMDDLFKYMGGGTEFRSSRTGYTFTDIREQFGMLREVNLYNLYSLILGNKITKDIDVLKARYQEEIANYNLDGKRAQEDIDDSDEIIDSYVRKMRESGNTNIKADYILDDVYYGHRGDSSDNDSSSQNDQFTNIDRTVVYDGLLENWVDAKDDYDYAEIDAAYCQYILQIYNGNAEQAATTASTNTRNQRNQTAQKDDFNIVTLPVTSRPASSSEIQAEIEEIISRMNELYEIVDETSEEYNDYLGASNIQTLTSVTAAPAYNLRLYMIIVAVIFLIIGCCGAILIGRIGDILEYIFLRDRATGCMNRVACDNQIRELAKEILPAGFTCVNLQLIRQNELNVAVGREKADEILMQIGQTLRDMFGSRKNSFVGYNGGGQFWTFYEEDQEPVDHEVERVSIVMRDQFAEYPVVYMLSGINAGEEDDYQIRSLISKSVANSVQYMTGREP